MIGMKDHQGRIKEMEKEGEGEKRERLCTRRGGPCIRYSRRRCCVQLNKLTTPCERDFLSYQPQSTSSCVSLGRFPPSPTMCPLPSPSFSSPSLAIHRLISLRDRASHPSSFLYVIPFTFSRSHFFHQGEKNPPAYRPPPTLALDLNSNPLISRIHSSPFPTLSRNYGL